MYLLTQQDILQFSHNTLLYLEFFAANLSPTIMKAEVILHSKQMEVRQQ